MQVAKLMAGACLSGALALLAAAPAGAAVVASEDFQTGASGWTDNTTEDPGANTGGFTRHLGRHGIGGATSKTFTLSGLQSLVTIAFDFYRIDSWDGEQFRYTVTDGVNTLAQNQVGLFFDGGPANIYAPTWTDRNTRIGFDFATTASSLTLTFTSTLDQGAGDEAWGVDNLLITDNARLATPGVPEPATWALMIMGFGAAGVMLRRRGFARAA